MAERPPALSPELKALLQGYREANAMPQPAKARVIDRLHEEASSGRPVWLWAGVGAVAAALLLWGAMTVTGALQSSAEETPGSQASMRATAGEGETAAVESEPPRPRQPPTSPRTADAPEPVLEPAPLEELAPTPAPAPVLEAPPEPESESSGAPRRRAPRRETTPAPKAEPEPEPQTPASRLGAENRLIARTWEHVRAKRYAKARSTLAEHARDFPGGVLTPERRALEVIVDCLARPSSAAGKAEAYARSGRTTLLAKVRSACAEKKSTPQ